MDRALTEKEAAHERAVKEMFTGIADRYDILNHLLSLNIDRSWRREVRKKLGSILERPEAIILDVACGTGDLSIELKRDSAASVVGTDFCRPMLDHAHAKTLAQYQTISYVEGDAMCLPFDDRQFDAVTIAFGLRNLPNVARGIEELNRILKPGGRLAVLEFSSPIVPGFGHLFNFYFAYILPRIGGAVSGSRGAYEYLPESVRKFPDQKKLAQLIIDKGFRDVGYINLTGGIAALHCGTKTK